MQNVETRIWIDGHKKDAMEFDYSITDPEQAANLLGFDGDLSSINFEYFPSE